MAADRVLKEGYTDFGTSSWDAADPVATDSLFVISGGQLINTNTDSWQALALAQFFLSRGFKGGLGTSGSPATFLSFSVGMDIDGGGGQHFIRLKGTSVYGKVVGSQGGKIWLQGNPAASGGVITTLVVFGGEVEIDAHLAVTNLIVLGGKVIVRKHSANAAAMTSVIVAGTGQLESERNAATVLVCSAAARCTWKDVATVTTVLRITSGLHLHNSTGTITLLDGVAGRLSTRGALRSFTITAGNLYRGFQIDDGTELTYILWGANQPVLYGYAGGSAL